MLSVDNVLSKSQNQPNTKTPNTRHKKPSFEFLARVVQETPKSAFCY